MAGAWEFFAGNSWVHDVDQTFPEELGGTDSIIFSLSEEELGWGGELGEFLVHFLGD